MAARSGHALLEALRPHVVALSVASDHLRRIKFPPMGEWQTVHVFTQTGRGRPVNGNRKLHTSDRKLHTSGEDVSDGSARAPVEFPLGDTEN